MPIREHTTGSDPKNRFDEKPGLKLGVDDSASVRAHDFNNVQSISNSNLQQVQHQSLTVNKVLQIPIVPGIWFGNMRSAIPD